MNLTFTKMHPLSRILLFLALLQALQPARAAEAEIDWSNWVVRVDVVQQNGSREIGSGVILAPQRVVTNCHVLRNASQITIARGLQTWQATQESGDAYRDLCFLRTLTSVGIAPAMARSDDIRISTPVVAAGYSGGTFKTTSGHIKGLYLCACDGGRVIRVSAPFEPGASGGGLFDLEGRLLGVLTFKSTVGGDFHFAVPIGWMKMLGQVQPGKISGSGSFWENVAHSSNYFLVACDLSAKQDWGGLQTLSIEWTRQEPDNPAAWMALGRAHLNQDQKQAAARDFQEVLRLDSTHTEAWWELQKLEIDLDQSLTPVE